MQLKGFCFILPTEFEELDHKKVQKAAPKQSSDRNCGLLILDFLRQSLHRLYRSKWARISHQEFQKKQYSSLFIDAEGVQIQEKMGGENPRIFSYSELFIGSNGFSEKEVLGSGGFGRVYRAVLPSDGTVVAVKCLAERGERFEQTFTAELMAVAHLRHRNLVKLRGWCIHEEELLLVYEYMPNRSLDRVLFRQPESLDAASPPLTWNRRRKIVHGLAAALNYLHQQLETQIIHRDVKASNVMLDSHFNARLGDFGLARWLEHNVEHEPKTPSVFKDRQFRLVETTRVGGTIGYLPPESFQKRSVATAKSDVFSFGIVVLEIVSGRRAVDLTYPDDQIILLDWIRRLSDEGALLQAGDARIPDKDFAQSDIERCIKIGLMSTLHDPNSRPNMKWVVEALSGNVYANAETIYMTAEPEVGGIASSGSKCSPQKTFPIVETPRIFTYEEIILATSNFSDSHRLAEVDFGTSYYGFLDNGHHILVKRLGMKTCPALRSRFANEFQNLGRLRHRNLIQLRGWCTEQGEMLVVYDYSASRLLSNIIFHHEPKRNNLILNWNQRYSVIKSLASAIYYLHEEWDERVIHKNITSSAVFLDPDMNPRLGSFALAEFLTRNEHGHHVVVDKKTSVRGIFGYMSPEYMDSGEATTMADVYSFGIVLLEVISGKMAVDFRQRDVLLVDRLHQFEARKRPYRDFVDWKLDAQYNERELVRLMKLGIACTSSNPEFRPSMRQIVSILDGHDQWFVEVDRKKEKKKEWRRRNEPSLCLIRRIQSLGIQ
ncbi:receptor like protein kinase S.2 isoform X2 [Primulina eburnea]|uniref:receptor like protein kinase S.2 isoform X2 n=1 Tax=Primulina eburnea TaxID=1245227 RepID=UPI003C6C41F7